MQIVASVVTYGLHCVFRLKSLETKRSTPIVTTSPTHNAAAPKQKGEKIMTITYKKTENCPISGQPRQLIGHVSAFLGKESGKHHFAGGHCNGLVSGQVLKELDAGRDYGAYEADGTTVEWIAE